MEIIKQGKLNKIEVTCPHCGMIGRIDGGETVRECPCCGAAVKWGQKSLGIPAAYGYPKYYYHYGKDEAARILDDEEVGELINSTVKKIFEIKLWLFLFRNRRYAHCCIPKRCK